MNKALKIFLIIGGAIISIILTLIITFFVITSDAKLQPDKLIDYTKSISVYDGEGNKIENASNLSGQKSVNLQNLNKQTVNAFIASEDRNFYSHNGLNYKRMIKATLKNAVSMSFKEGASTISQQLIKNTHLSNDKTIKRKLKEIRLTKQLERKYAKDQILEMYLNTIYFGHNCYGLQKAANYYFDKPAEELDLEQSATVVGLLISPNNYSPFKKPEACLKRRNIVLKNMLDCKFINKNEYEEAAKKPLSAVQSNSSLKNSDYLHSVFEELEDLNIIDPEHLSEIKICTYLDAKAQSAVEKQNFDCDSSIFIRSDDGGIIAYSSSIGNAKRQIGSTAKPIFVYAPAIEQKKLHLITKIKDEPINYNGYAPENFDKTYRGYVSVEDSIKKSLNVPAVKTLNTLKLDDVSDFAKKMNINLTSDDKNLSLALGAMKEGISLKQLCDAYSTFQNGGEFTSSAFIKEITDKNGKVLYARKPTSKKVFSEGTASLINKALIETVKSGTAKKLNKLNFDVACKTGTCGNGDGNTDAYSVGYTGDLCFGVWLGSKDNSKISVTGGNDCCNAAYSILSEICEGKKCKSIETECGTVTLDIDRQEYDENQKIVICDDICPKLNRMTAQFAKNNIPTEKSVKFSKPTIKTPQQGVNNNEIDILLCQTKYYSYRINRVQNSKTEEIYNGKWIDKIIDRPEDGEYYYTVTPYYTNGGKMFEGETITLPKVKILKSGEDKIKVPDIVNKDWFNS